MPDAAATTLGVVKYQLSRRGAGLIEEAPLPEYIKCHWDNRDAAYDPVSNPDGYIGLCVAENKLVWDLLEPRLAAGRDVEPESFGYQDMVGAPRFRAVLADFLGKRLAGRRVDPDHLAVLSGAGSVLETLFYVLTDPGDGVLVPTPSYAAFWPDLETRDEAVIIPVHSSSEDGFELTVRDLDAAVAGSERPVRALLYTNPNNPLGRVDDPAKVEEVLNWGRDNGLHVVLDEVYALSVFGEKPFVSGARLKPRLDDWLHVIWAFSKDFAASGLRVGVLMSENESVVKAVDALAYWSAVSGDTQSLLADMLADETWVDGFIAENQRRLGNAYRSAAGALDQHGIPYVPAEAGFFFLVDVRGLMDEVSWEAEDRLWRRLVDEFKLNLTPGSACHCAEPGFMRLVFSSEPTAAVVEGVNRLGSLVRSLEPA